MHRPPAGFLHVLKIVQELQLQLLAVFLGLLHVRKKQKQKQTQQHKPLLHELRDWNNSKKLIVTNRLLGALIPVVACPIGPVPNHCLTRSLKHLFDFESTAHPLHPLPAANPAWLAVTLLLTLAILAIHWW